MKVVHIGYPKTGTSFLQKDIFPSLTNLQLIDYKYGKEFSHKLIKEGIFFNPEKALNEFRSISNDNILLSYEGLIGNQVTGQGINSSSLPIKLKELGFDKVIITLRKNREKWIKSIYSQYIKMGGKLYFKDFLQNPKRLDYQYPCYHPEMIDFSEENANYFEEIFGKKNVLKLYLEDLTEHKGEFINKLESFLEEEINLNLRSKTNESLSPFQLSILRFSNNFTNSRIAPSSSFKFFSSSKILKLLSLFSKKSISKK